MLPYHVKRRTLVDGFGNDENTLLDQRGGDGHRQHTRTRMLLWDYGRRSITLQEHRTKLMRMILMRI